VAPIEGEESTVEHPRRRRRPGEGGGGEGGIGALRVPPLAHKLKRGAEWSPNKPERPPTPQEVDRSAKPAKHSRFPTFSKTGVFQPMYTEQSLAEHNECRAGIY